MFGDITIPYDSVLLYNVCKLKEGRSFDEVELAIGETCTLTKEMDGFIAGEVLEVCEQTYELGYEIAWQGEKET